MTTKQRVRDALTVSPKDFFWDPPIIATLLHSTLPWYDSVLGGPLDATPLAAPPQGGERERLSLVAQFASHCAFLQFAGIPVGEFDAGEWAVLRRRGSDARLIRIAARRRGEPESVLTLVESFASAIHAPHLEVFDRAWARAESVFQEVFERLSNDAVADLRWMRASGSGAVLGPGVSGLERLWNGPPGRFAADDAVRALRAIAAIDQRPTLCVIENTSPVVPLSALAVFGIAEKSVADAAEKLLATLAARKHVIVVRDGGTIDASSQQVLEILDKSELATWVTADRGEVLAPAQLFIIAPRITALRAISARASLEADPVHWIVSFTSSIEFDHFLQSGSLPPVAEGRALAEPRRSWLAALALLGRRIDRELAARYLQSFFFAGDLGELVVEGITALDEDGISFANEQTRAAAAAHIPHASRAALCRTAAEMTAGVTSALLYVEAGDCPRAVELLEAVEWGSSQDVVDALRKLPAGQLSMKLAGLLANALINEGLYDDAIGVGTRLEPLERELVLARVDRRRGDYATALARLDRMTTLEGAGALLRAELLRLEGRYEEALTQLAVLDGDSTMVALTTYERALIANDTNQASEARPDDAYLCKRLETYRATAAGDFESAAAHARDAFVLARSATERIDAALDQIFALFSAGSWDETRATALQALSEIDESHGDRAAAAILFTLTYLAADDGQWAHAEIRLKRLRSIYQTRHDARGLVELGLPEAQLAFSRGRFDDAERYAQVVVRMLELNQQIREAAALILDEIDFVRGSDTPMRSSGRSGNRELKRRWDSLVELRHATSDPTDGRLASSTSRSARLAVFRVAVAWKRDDVSGPLATELGVELTAARERTPADLRCLRAAAIAPFPFGAATLPVAWRMASRNRLGRWSQEGTLPQLSADELNRALDTEGAGWIRTSEREVIFIEGSSHWPEESRQALAAIMTTRAENARLRRILEQQEQVDVASDAAPNVDGMIGDAPLMREVYDRIRRIAPRDVVVLILGASGTGKELAARAIHRHSRRRSHPFTAINCAALPENLIESELFGHSRGAFTGADRDHAGLVETTDGGTLFLDEIGELPMAAQAKLLRFLQEKEFRRVGETANRTADIRIVCATNRNLEEAVEDGSFREDLFYRVHGVDIVLPALRDRGTDILKLANSFLDGERARHRAGPTRMSEEVEAALLAYAWPGNVRELQNTIRAAHAVAGDVRELTMEFLPQRVRTQEGRRLAGGSYQDAVARFRRELIERSLEGARGNQNRAASMLQISRQALAYQIRELGIAVRKPSRGRPALES